MANDNKTKNNVVEPGDIKKMYKGYEFAIRDDDHLATNAFCLIFGVQVEESINSQKDQKKQQVSSFFKPTPEKIEQMKGMVRYRKKDKSGSFGEWNDMKDFFSKEEVSVQDEFHIIRTIYQMVNNDLLLVFFPSTSKG